jgi:hypothetical protein
MTAILKYCSPPILYTLHSVFPKAIEKRWSQFPNRYRDGVVDFIYETKEPIDIVREPNHYMGGLSLYVGHIYHNVKLLRPPRLQKCVSYLTRDNTDYLTMETLKWDKMFNHFTITNKRWPNPRQTIYSPTDTVDSSEWEYYPPLSRSKLIASQYSFEELKTIASYFMFLKTWYNQQELNDSILRLYEMNFDFSDDLYLRK